jgi:hypothetical protein
MPEYIKARIIPFGNTLVGWTATNPIIAQGETVVEIGTPMRAKLGDGATPYLSLPYITGGAGTPQSLQDTLNIGNVVVEGGGNVGKIISNDVDGIMRLEPQVLKIVQFATGFDMVGMVYDATTPYFFIKSTSNPNLGKIVGSAFSAPHTWILPNKDGTFAMLSDITAAGNLQGVLNAGNAAVNGSGNVGEIIFTDAASGENIVLNPNGFQLLDGVDQYVALLISGGKGTLSLDDNSGLDGRIQAFGLTNQRTILIPDEGAGANIDDTIVLHKTKDIVLIGTGTVAAPTLGVVIDPAGAINFFSGTFILGFIALLGGTIKGTFGDPANKFSYFDPLTFKVKNTGTSSLEMNSDKFIFSDLTTGFATTVNFSSAAANRQFTINSLEDNGNFEIVHMGSDTQNLVAAPTMVINHGRSYTPSHVIPIQRSAITGATNWWVSAIAATTFTITFDAAVTASVTFDFKTMI